jgi:hypothetical protein
MRGSGGDSDLLLVAAAIAGCCDATVVEDREKESEGGAA